MKVKIDTKEKFHVITPLNSILYDNIAAEISVTAQKFLTEQIKNVVLNLSFIDTIESEEAAQSLVLLQQLFYENHASFVICNINSKVEGVLEKFELLEVMNVTPTESEAWDIVQMEEIERELLDNEEE